MLKLKEFVSSLRNKGNVYKQKRQETSELKTENGILTRTLEILAQKDKHLIEVLMNLEEQRGISGYFSMQEDSGKLDIENVKEISVDEISTLVRQLSVNINDKKAQLAPVIKDLRPLRQQCQDLQFDFDQKKGAYDSCAAGLESNTGKLESDVKKQRDNLAQLESDQFKMRCQLELLEAKEALIKKEMNYFVSTDAEYKANGLQLSVLIIKFYMNLNQILYELNREKIQKEIGLEMEKQEIFKQKQRELKDNEAFNKRQIKMWKDLQQLLEVKKKCLQKQLEAKANNAALVGRKDHLIL